ncbi:MAG: DUF4153 domain-containing protein [Gemmatimonadaceae bacterium]
MRDSSTILIWTLAVITSVLGAAILYAAMPGINWPIWVGLASISVLLSRRLSGKKIEAPLVVLLAWATLLSIGVAVSANEAIQVFSILSDAMLLGLAVIVIGAERWSALSVSLIPTIPFLAPFRVWRSSIQEAADTPRSVSSPRARSIIKGTLLSAPLVIILIALLGSADPVIRWTTDWLAAWLPDWTFPPRLLFFAFLLSITLGANSLAARQLTANLPAIPRITRPWTVGITEQRMVLWSAAVVLWIFVLLQISYLIHPPPAVLNSGVTFADYARRGFGEMSFAVTIVGAIILILEYTRPIDASEADRRTLKRLEFALVIALELVLLSAFRRVILYEQAYGFTTARLIAQAYMVGMGAALIALALEIWRGTISIAFARRVAEIALGVLTILVFWNYDDWIVNRNVDRAVQNGKFDANYATTLSPNAIPALVARRADIPAPERAMIDNWLACRREPSPRRWFELNLGVQKVTLALETMRPAGWTRPETCKPGQVTVRPDTSAVR